MARFEAGPETKQRWQDRRGVLVAALGVICVLNLLRVGNGLSGGAIVFFALVAGLGALAVVRIGDAHRRATLPPGVLHAVTASLLIDELAAPDQFRAELAGVRRRRLRMFGLGRVAGRLDITPDRISWVPGRVARWGRMPTLEVPLAGVARVEVVSAAFPIDYAGVEVSLADGRRLAFETRGATRLRAAFARTAVAAHHRQVDPLAAPLWEVTLEGPEPVRLSPAKAYGLLGVWAALFVLALGPLAGDESAKSNLVVDVGAVVFLLAAVPAIGFLIVRSPRGVTLTTVAAAAGVVASIGDLFVDLSTGAVETVLFTAFLAVTLRLRFDQPTGERTEPKLRRP